MEDLVLYVGALLRGNIGKSEIYSFENEELSLKIDIMKMEKGLNVQILKVDTVVDMKCDLCLCEYKEEISFDDGERQFYMDPQKNTLDVFESFLIDKKNSKIDISDMIRQEIILHFPTISVCSTHCRGLCPHCGENRNLKKCKCTDIEVNELKPLSSLKDLIK